MMGREARAPGTATSDLAGSSLLGFLPPAGKRPGASSRQSLALQH